MALDGIVIGSIVSELKEKIIGGRIYKIYQPEQDELNIIIKNNRENYRLLLSANASLPLVYLASENKQNPLSAPNFCMLLRKHIGNGKILSVKQPGFERIVEIEIEHLNELGDVCTKRLIIEIMGKHSNIIFVDEDNVIIDSIKHVGLQMSSVREVLPGRDYSYPPGKGKISPYQVDKAYFDSVILMQPMELGKAIYTTITGFSPAVANALCLQAGLGGENDPKALDKEEVNNLFNTFKRLMDTYIVPEAYEPCIYYNGYEPKEFSAVPLAGFGKYECRKFDSISHVLEEYYGAKSVISRIRQKSTDLRKIVSNALERTSKKYDLQRSQLKDTEKREKFKVYGELINTYGYHLEPGAKSLTALNYYTNEEIVIPLDDTLTPAQNSKKYFEKYNKLKRTYEALTELVAETQDELNYLLSVQNALEIAKEETDLSQIKEELIVSGYIKGKGGKKKAGRTEKSKPFHYISSDGFHMYVGKNNFQNDELTFHVANGGDMWFHAKQMPGSHVIVKLEGAKELPDRTYEEAARLAAYYSAGRDNPKVEVDYTKRAELKKPPKAKPGFVIYHTNYSMNIEPDIHGIREFEQK